MSINVDRRINPSESSDICFVYSSLEEFDAKKNWLSGNSFLLRLIDSSGFFDPLLKKVAEIRKDTVSPKQPVWKKDLLAETFSERAIITTGTYDDVADKEESCYTATVLLFDFDLVVANISQSFFQRPKTIGSKRSKEEGEWAEKETGTHSTTEACRIIYPGISLLSFQRSCPIVWWFRLR